METSQPVDVGRWRKIVELGGGRTGSVTLCIEPASRTDEKSYGERHHDVLHAVKRVNRQCATNDGALRRVLQEKKALQALGGVREPMRHPRSRAVCTTAVGKHAINREHDER